MPMGIKPSKTKLAMAQHNRHRFPPPASIPRLPLLTTQSIDQQRPIRLTPSIKHQFRSSIPLLAARIPSQLVTKFKADPSIKKAVLNSKNLRSVEPDPDSTDQSFKLLVLNTPHQDQIPECALKVLDDHSIEIKKTTLELDWDYWMADEIIARLLPIELTQIPSSFTIIGHIAHFNFRDEFLAYRYLIGQVILEKNLAIRTVVNKIDSINSQFRFFEMELLAGEPNYNVTLSQGGCRFQFDFSKVYYNPRLSTEHDLLSGSIRKDEVVVDAFAGVGPFAMRAASKQKAWVLASDLNPASVEALGRNVKLNKLQGRVVVSEGDGRVKIKDAVLDLWREEPFGKANRLADHFIINLPDSAISFLDAFVGLYAALEEDKEFMEAITTKKCLPLVHCYCFTKKVEEAEADICSRASEVMGTKVDSESVKRFELKFVRQVAPHKEMYRLTFELPLEVVMRHSTHQKL